jgi:predicted methyltransferase
MTGLRRRAGVGRGRRRTVDTIGRALALLAFAAGLVLAPACPSGGPARPDSQAPQASSDPGGDAAGGGGAPGLAGDPHHAAAGAPPAGSPPDAAAQERDDDATARHPFDDAQRWAKVFDDPGRDAWQKPNEVIAAMGIRPGMMVADIGAGTGYFTAHLSRAVGPEGTVLAIDPEPEMVKHLGQRAHKDRLRNVLPVLGMFEDPFLPRGHVDRVLIVDTYHHIDDRLDYFGRMRRDLAPGGRLVIVDFHKRPLPVGPPPEHKLEREQVVREMEAAGWRLDGEITTLPYQYVLIFDPAPGAASTGASR